MKSLERSLQLGLVVSLLVLMLLFWWSGSLAARLLTESMIYQRLEGDADVLVSAMTFPVVELDAPRLTDAQVHPLYDVPDSGKYYAIHVDSGEDIQSRSMWEQGIEIGKLAPGEQTRTRRTGVAGEALLIWAGGFSRDGHLFSVVVAEDITPVQERIRLFQIYFAVIALLLLLALLVVQHLIVRWSVHKLDHVRRDILRLEQGQVSTLSEDVPAEILPLVREFNRLLQLFDQRLRQSRNSLGNLAHALKGPLNLLLRASERVDDATDTAAHTDIHLTEPESGSAQDIHQNALLIRQLIERELKRARLAGRGAAGRVFDAERELPALIGLLRQVYSDRQITVRSHIAVDADIPLDRQDMLELIGNLLDNAVKWASRRAQVSIDVARHPGDGVAPEPADKDSGHLIIQVEDDGPGCSDEEISQLTGRGVRLDERVAGHGLGLSIVQDIVDSYGGVLSLGRSQSLGGFQARVVLPISLTVEAG